jgi:hypothetical protein
MFSLGATIWNVMTLQTPPDAFDEATALSELPTHYSDELRNIVLRCFGTVPNLRPTALDVLDQCIERHIWKDTLVGPYGTLVSTDFDDALEWSWSQCRVQLKATVYTVPLKDERVPALLDEMASIMKLDQQEEYGELAVFIAGEFVCRLVPG